MADETNEERQNNELEALKAIYNEKLIETPKSASIWQPLDVTLSLDPQQGSGLQEAHTFVDLHIICSEKYPYEVPKIEIVKSKGLSTQQLNTLLQELSVQAQNLKGEVMVFELASLVQTFLHQYNKPGFHSLYAEMLNRQLTKQKVEEEQKKVLEDKTRQELRLEIKNKKEALKQELRRRNNSEVLKEDEDVCLQRLEALPQPFAKNPLITADLLESRDGSNVMQSEIELSDFNQWIVARQGVSRLENEFEVLQFLGEGAFGDVLKVRNKLDRCFYAIKCIELNPTNKLLYKKITREVKLLSRLNHENVVRYFNSWIETSSHHKYSSDSQTSSNKTEELDQKAVDMLPMKEVSLDWDLSKRNNSESSEDSSDDNCWIKFL